MGPEITNPDYRDIPSKQHDQYYIDRVAELIKARLPGVKAEPSIVETCIYSVSYQTLGSYCNTLDILVSLLSVYCSSVHRAETEHLQKLDISDFPNTSFTSISSCKQPLFTCVSSPCRSGHLLVNAPENLL